MTISSSFFAQKKHRRDFSSVFRAFSDLCHEPYAILPRTIIEYHNQDHLSSVFFKTQKKNIEEIPPCFFAHDVIEPYLP